MEINQDIARKVLDTVNAGLASGLGEPVPGKMCVEAAVCYALGLPHGDDPGCVAQSLRRLKIILNDSRWSSDQARADGLRRLALVQLGSAGALDEKEFVRRLVDYAIRKSVPLALRAAAYVHKDSDQRAKLLAASSKCEKEGTASSAREARATASAASAASDASAAAAAKAAARAAARAAAADAAAAAARAAAWDALAPIVATLQESAHLCIERMAAVA